MKDVLGPITIIPGVRFAAVVSLDGVPISYLRGEQVQGDSRCREEITAEFHAFGALAASCVAEFDRAGSQIQWTPSSRIVLEATRGVLVVHRAPRALLLTVLEHGVSAAEVSVPMSGAIARMERSLRHLDVAVNQTQTQAQSGDLEMPKGISASQVPPPDRIPPNPTSNQRVPEPLGPEGPAPMSSQWEERPGGSSNQGSPSEE